MNRATEMKFTNFLSTGGNGLWSEVAKKVKTTWLVVNPLDEELRVYFDARIWNIMQHGLIYTDRTFLKELKSALKEIGLNSNGIDYTEQGMQAYNYVSLHYTSNFIKSWNKLTKKEAS